jgi:hypothetical protein
VLLEGRYDFVAEAKARLCRGDRRECLAGEKIELPAFKLIGGGFISGQVVNTATGNRSPFPRMEKNRSCSGCSGRLNRQEGHSRCGWPRWTRRGGSPAGGPGRKLPYFVNTRGVRMAWDTRSSPVVVKERDDQL